LPVPGAPANKIALPAIFLALIAPPFLLPFAAAISLSEMPVSYKSFSSFCWSEEVSQALSLSCSKALFISLAA
jgi:hypothetical protein